MQAVPARIIAASDVAILPFAQGTFAFRNVLDLIGGIRARWPAARWKAAKSGRESYVKRRSADIVKGRLESTSQL